MEEVLLFIITFVVLLIVYELFLVLPLNNNNNKKELLEVSYLKALYNLDYNKISYKQLLQICSVTSCLDISIIVTIISFINSLVWKIVFGIICGFILIKVSYYFVFLFYKKKGMIIDGKHK